MTAKEWLEKHHPLKPGEYYLSWTKLMDKYGEYMWNAAIDAAAENAELYEETCMGHLVGGVYVDKESILKLKK